MIEGSPGTKGSLEWRCRKRGQDVCLLSSNSPDGLAVVYSFKSKKFSADAS
jgi:hypothetical protein